jgi:hypothetical protein
VYFPLRDHAQPDVVSWSHGSGEKEESYFFFFVVFLVVFLDDFLADFLAMRFTSFQHVNVKIVKMYVNVFSKLAQKFSAPDFSRCARFHS